MEKVHFIKKRHWRGSRKQGWYHVDETCCGHYISGQDNLENKVANSDASKTTCGSCKRSKKWKKADYYSRFLSVHGTVQIGWW